MCIRDSTYAKKVIDAGYTLMPNYRNLMLADNNLDNPEFIFTINYDRIRTQTYGGTTFLINGAIGGDMVSSNYGTTDAWSGHRTTKALVNKFSDPSGATDKRAQFFSNGQNLEINNISVSYTHLDVYKRQDKYSRLRTWFFLCVQASV